MNINGIIIAAGYSKRLGMFKPLAPFKESTFIECIINKLNPFCESIVVVSGFNNQLLKEKLSINNYKKFLIIYNKNFDKGMFSSIQKGISQNKNSDWFLIHQVDQPGLPKVFYKEFITNIDDKHNWIQPKYNERKGHPILVKKETAELIIEEDINSNLRVVSNNTKVNKKIWDCNYKEILQDIDTKEDYQELLNPPGN
ncbi:MAG: hypothetical protein CO128_06365 [Ignavibacteriales bacterium CG_4_9_14_3_um_filter_30_11]|nr:MAG: hypothetical protein CO128_06365 [Ignavibacteriales bacterium CG_4_9_14_3_um_filter_30_11]